MSGASGNDAFIEIEAIKERGEHVIMVRQSNRSFTPGVLVSKK